MPSYRVNTISLSPHQNKNKPVFYLPTSLHRHQKTYNTLDPNTPEKPVGESLMPPSPW